MTLRFLLSKTPANFDTHKAIVTMKQNIITIAITKAIKEAKLSLRSIDFVVLWF